MLKYVWKSTLTSTTAVALVLLSGCSMLNGDASGDSNSSSSEAGFTNITNEIVSWDMCEVLPIDPILEQSNADGYGDGFEPHHVGLGSAMNSEAISCAGDIEVVDTNGYTYLLSVILSVFPGKSTEHVDDMWELRQDGFYGDAVEQNSRGMGPEQLLIDKDLEGDWSQGHAYAILGTEGEFSGAAGSMIVDVRTENYIVEVWLTVPVDQDKAQAARYELGQEEIDASTSLEFDRVEFVNWVADEHIHTMFDAVSSSLES